MNPNQFAELTTLQQLAYQAGAIMRNYWQKPVAARRKHDLTWVCEVDLRISRLVKRTLESAFPTHARLTEETIKEYLPGYRGFIVDELDGTRSFLMRRPGFTFQAAYFDHEDEITVGLIYDPLADLMVWGRKGEGVWTSRQGHIKQLKPLHTPTWDDLRFGNHRYSYSPTQWKLYQQLGVQPHQIVPSGSIGSKVLSLVRGHFDVIVGTHRHIPVWDWAAGQVILQELGYAVCHFDGSPLHISETATPHPFGYLVCPQAHRKTILSHLHWVAKKCQGAAKSFQPVVR